MADKKRKVAKDVAEKTTKRKKSIITKDVETKTGMKQVRKERQVIAQIERENFDAMKAENALESIRDSENAKLVETELTDDQRFELEYHEKQIDDGRKKFLSIGKHLFAVHNKGLYVEYDSWKDYCEQRWQMSSSGALDLIASYRTWKIVKTKPTDQLSIPELKQLSNGDAAETETPSGDVAVDVLTDDEAPSQSAVDELRIVNKYLERGEMTESEFKRHTENVTRLLYDFARDSVDGKMTAPAVAKTFERIVEFLTGGAIEVEGKDSKVKTIPVDFVITNDVYENWKKQKQEIAVYLTERDARLNAPHTRQVNGNDAGGKAKDKHKIPPPTIDCYKCGDVTSVFNVLHGAIQLACGDIWTMPPDEHQLVFDAKRTRENPLTDDDLEIIKELGGKKDG